VNSGQRRRLKTVLAAWGLEAKGLKQVKDVVRVKAAGGRFCLKPLRHGRDRALLVAAVSRHVRSRGFEQVLPLLPTAAGDVCVDAGGDSFILMRWVSGREPNFGRGAELAACVETLAQFHLAARGFVPPAGIGVRDRLGRWVRSFARHLKDLESFHVRAGEASPPTEFDRLYRDAYPWLLSRARQALDTLLSSAYQGHVTRARRQLPVVHGDAAARNFVCDDAGVAWLIDLDNCNYDLRTSDIYRLVRRTIKKQHWDFSLARSIIDHYEQVSPLESAEFPLILARLQFPQKFWRIARRYYRRHSPRFDWAPEKFAAKLHEYLASRTETEEFLRRFAELSASRLEGAVEGQDEVGLTPRRHEAGFHREA